MQASPRWSGCVPFSLIDDTRDNLTGILDYCIEAGVRGILRFGMSLTLREGNRTYVYRQLDRHFLRLKAEYVRRWGNTYVLDSPNSHALMSLLHRRCRDPGILHDNQQLFRYLSNFESKDEQMSLF